MKRTKLINHLTELLKPFQISDYCPNGLQVEGKSEIKKIVTGVTASQALIDAAIERGADAILVHHGYFWKGEDQTITGMKKRRIQRLLAHDINLIAYHLPLDVHPELGNNAQLGALLGLDIERPLEPWNKSSVAVKGKLATPMSVKDFAILIENKLGRAPLVNAAGDHLIKTVAWCTGGGQSFIDLAASQGIDAYLTGEASEQTIHSSNEQSIHFFAAGHHATERYGVKALGEYLATQFDLEVEFIDIHNPV
ncbi:Nif3-like dinuclear metal center hexameric protein [Pseudoalteromonas xiamenensis]